MKQKETELDAARSESVADIAGCLVRLSGASKFLSLPPRVALADIARVLADAFDEGKVLSPGDAPRRRPSSALNTSMSVTVNFIARCDGALGCFSFRAQSAGATAVRCC